jgi:competence protein ComEA
VSERLGSAITAIPPAGGGTMARLSLVLLATLCSLGPLAAASVDAQNPSDLIKKGGDLKSLAEPLDLNSASLDQLKKLPGLGDADAKKIVAGRPFSKTSDLVDKKILSSSVYEKGKGFLTVK